MIFQVLLNEQQRDHLLDLLSPERYKPGEEKDLAQHFYEALDEAHDLDDGEGYCTPGPAGDLHVQASLELVY